jgi:hypothetical protein
MENILSAFFPEGLLEYFEVVSYELTEQAYIFDIKEKNIAPYGYQKEEIESKGFYESGSITDFPLRGKRCEYRVSRRKWLVKDSGKIIHRDWNIIAKGTRITTEFATFLKGIDR